MRCGGGEGFRASRLVHSTHEMASRHFMSYHWVKGSAPCAHRAGDSIQHVRRRHFPIRCLFGDQKFRGELFSLTQTSNS
jgi:hypothetical protein